MSSCLYCQSQSPLGTTFCCRACEILYDGQFQIFAKKAQTLKKEKWAALDTPEARHLYRIASSAKTENFRLYVEGLQCASCIHLLEKLPEFEPQVHSAQVLFGSSELLIDIEKDLPLSNLLTLIEEMGYSAHLLKKGESAQESWQNDSRRWLKEIAVAGACAGNIMMFIVPVYAGVSGSYKTVFLWLSFTLFLPILIYSAQSIYQGAWRALKTRTLNTDLALTIALWGGFILSTFNLLNGSDIVYYDSTASFLFLILVSRYFVKKVQRRTLLHLQKQDSWEDASYLKKVGTDWAAQIAPLLLPGDEIKLLKNQVLPCDAEALSSQSEWDTSLMTGEVLPRLYPHDMKLHAGLKLLSAETYVRILKPYDQSEIQQMLQMVSRQSLNKSQFIRKMDLWSQRLLMTVFVVGILFFAFYSSINLEAALQRTLALWIVACPCSLAFAAPLTLYRALLEARRRGLLIKNHDVFEKASNIKNLIFDKTGTLTTGQLSLIKSEPSDLHQKYKDIVLELEKTSEHPIAFAFRRAWPEGPQLHLPVSDVYENVGEKVYGLLDGKMYILCRAPESSDMLMIDLLENGKKVARFSFKDELFVDTQKTLQTLQKKFTTFILSGDSLSRVQLLAKELSLPTEKALGEQTPLQKWNFVKDHKSTLMMGDGANDAAALQEATIGVASHGSLEVSFRAADIYLLKKGLNPLLQFFSISRRYQIILKRNFILAITYNSIAGACALLGWINPLVAALLMPLSSLILLLSTMEGWS